MKQIISNWSSRALSRFRGLCCHPLQVGSQPFPEGIPDFRSKCFPVHLLILQSHTYIKHTGHLKYCTRVIYIVLYCIDMQYYNTVMRVDFLLYSHFWKSWQWTLLWTCSSVVVLSLPPPSLFDHMVSSPNLITDYGSPWSSSSPSSSSYSHSSCWASPVLASIALKQKSSPVALSLLKLWLLIDQWCNMCLPCEESEWTVRNWSLAFWMAVSSLWTQEKLMKLVPNVEKCV